MTKSEISAVNDLVASLKELQAVLGQIEQPKAVAKPKAKRPVVEMTPKVSREAKKAQNKVLWRQINGKVKKAENAKTEVLAQGFLQEATAMTPAKWTSVHNKILAQHEVLCPSITV